MQVERLSRRAALILGPSVQLDALGVLSARFGPRSRRKRLFAPKEALHVRLSSRSAVHPAGTVVKRPGGGDGGVALWPLGSERWRPR